jgi:hypothetical protein
MAERIRVMPAFIRAALMDDGHAEFRRWSYSAMLVVALHGAAAMAVLAWQVTSKRLDPYGPTGVGPLLIDLAPLPAARSGEQDGAERAVNAADSAKPAELRRSDDKAGASGPVADAPIVSAPSDNAGRDTGGGAAASGAFAAGAVQKGPTEVSRGLRVDPGPLDTSITVTAPLHPHKSFGVFNRNSMILLRSVKHPGNHGPGARVQDRVNAAIEREKLHQMERARNGRAPSGTNSLGIRNAPSSTPLTGVHNAVGAATGNNNAGKPESGVANSTTRNAVGMTIPVHSNPHGENIDEHREGIAGLKAREGITGLKTAVPPGNTGLMAATSPPGILNGRGTPRPGTGLTTLGGVPKIVPGSLSGSDFHPKHQQ